MKYFISIEFLIKAFDRKLYQYFVIIPRRCEIFKFVLLWTILYVSMQEVFFRSDSKIKQTLCSSIMWRTDKAWTRICYRITKLANLRTAHLAGRHGSMHNFNYKYCGGCARYLQIYQWFKNPIGSQAGLNLALKLFAVYQKHFCSVLRF